MMKKIFVTIFSLVLTLSYLAIPTSGLAADDDTIIKVGQPESLNLSSPSPAKIIPNIFKIFFIVGAIGVVLMILWGAVEWIFSGGNKEKVAAARSRIMNGIIGFALLALAFLIASVIGKVVGFNPLQEFTVPFIGD